MANTSQSRWRPFDSYLTFARFRYILLIILAWTVIFYVCLGPGNSRTGTNYLSILIKDNYTWRGNIFGNFYTSITSGQSNADSFDFSGDNKNEKFGDTSIKASSSAKHTLACVFPTVNPFETGVVRVAGLNTRPVECEGSYLPDLTFVENNTLLVNISRVKENTNLTDFQHCRYRHIWRHETDDNKIRYSDWEKPFTVKTYLPVDTEFIVVECRNKNSELVSKSYFSLIPERKEFDEIDSLNLKKRQIESVPKETLNVIMVGLDSVSRYQFLRSFKKTYSYLMIYLKSFDLTMHNQLGRNTFPNFLPLFTGNSLEEVERYWHHSQHLDAFDMIWRTFEQAGYRTFFTEDWPLFGPFHYLKKGFTHKFARYNNRPLALAMDKDKAIWNHSRYCAGNQLEFNFQLDYVARLIEKFQDRPIFGVTMQCKVTHGDSTAAKMLDQHLYNFYTSLNDRGFLNKTLLVTFSDHGQRWGPVRRSMNGFFESRTPYTILTFPEWFLLKYPDIAENLKVNTKRLTTHFDTHATLLDLLYFKSDNPPPIAPVRHGVSLLKAIPLDRTCKDVPIPVDFCVCGHNGVEEISHRSNLSKNLADIFLRELNSKRDPKLCATFKLKQIISVLRIVFLDTAVKEKKKKVMYKVTLQTIPGNAVYETNVYFENSTTWKVGEHIERLNLYRGQTDCIENTKDRLFCYCKNLLTDI